MSQLIKENRPLLMTIVIGSFITGIALGILGIILVYQGATGDTEFTFFGQTFKSTSIGIAAIFLGATVIVLLVRRTLKSVEHTISSEAAPQPQQKVEVGTHINSNEDVEVTDVDVDHNSQTGIKVGTDIDAGKKVKISGVKINTKE